MQTTEASACLSLVFATASADGRSVEWTGSNELVLALDAVSPDGATTRFELVGMVDGGKPKFKERVQHLLPAFCPNRHINSDGTFCLSSPRHSSELATEPLPVLLKFLRLQLSAERDGRWPTTTEWAHGDAATHQLKAEEAAARISPEWHRLLVEKKLKRREKGRFVSILAEEKRFSIWRKEQRVATLRQRCFCGRSNCAVVQCGTHAADAVELVKELSLMDKAEADFWRRFDGRQCCGTMKNCPLKKGKNSND